MTKHTLTKNTLIPIGLAVSIAVVLFATGSWKSLVEAQIDKQADHNAIQDKAIESFPLKVEKLNDNLDETNKNVTDLKILLESIKSDLR